MYYSEPTSNIFSKNLPDIALASAAVKSGSLVKELAICFTSMVWNSWFWISRQAFSTFSLDPCCVRPTVINCWAGSAVCCVAWQKSVFVQACGRITMVVLSFVRYNYYRFIFNASLNLIIKPRYRQCSLDFGTLI